MTDLTKRIVAAALVAVSVSGMGITLAQPAPGGQNDGQFAPPPPAEPMTVKGTVAGMNLDPDGMPNGLLLKTGDGPLTQINFPPHVAAEIAKVVKPGVAVTAMTRPLPPGPPRPAANGDVAPPPPAPAAPPADHPVVELVSITPDGGTELTVPRPDELPTRHVDGKVAGLNYNREGQVDGAVLEDGTLIHTGPAAAKALKLAVGQTLSVDGSKPPRGTDKVLAPKTVNGTQIERPHPPRPRPEDGAPPAPPAP